MGSPFPLKLPLPMGDLHPHVIHYSWDHPSQQPKQHLDCFSRFLHSSPDSVPILTMGRLYPPKCPFPWGIWTPSNSWFHGSTRPKLHLDRLSHFCRAHKCDRTTDRQTDHATRSVTYSRRSTDAA